MNQVRLGISRCLLGERVRYDGGHKLDRFLKITFGHYVEYVPVCPEVECGLPIPREPMHLEGDPRAPRLLTVRTGQNMTDRMTLWALKRVVELEKEELCGFIFKSDSPSSGMERVKVYDEKGTPVKKGVGVFARIFMEHFPLLPVEDEGRLHDPKLRENFIERIFTLERWRKVLERKESGGNIVDFHSKHELLILSHSPGHHQRMVKLLAQARKLSTKELYHKYQTLLVESLKLRATQKKKADVLRHMTGYFKKRLSSDEEQELLEVIDHYRNESIPFIVPMTLIGHYVRKYDQPYLKQQVYVNPHPLELQLRNHA